MKRYFHLLRLQDQYLTAGSAIAAGIYLQDRSWQMVAWIAAATCLSIAAFVINEITDSGDTDIHSWNGIHTKRSAIRMSVAGALFVVFTLAGFVLAWFINALWGALLMWSISTAYSLPPIRLKTRVGVDIPAQLLAFWIIPAAYPVYRAGGLFSVLPVLFVFACIIWTAVFPYELSDFSADVKAGIHSTHTLLGLRKSLVLGMGLGIIGLAWYWVLRVDRLMPWSIPYVVFPIYALGSYARWLRVKKQKDIERSLQQYVRHVKPYSYLLVPYLLLVWLWPR